MPLSMQQKKYFKAIGHHLKPVVMIAGNGLSEGVQVELERALEDHELIKVKVVGEDRDAKHAIAEAICSQTGAEQVQIIGKILLLYRPAKKPDPRLSNLLRTPMGRS